MGVPALQEIGFHTIVLLTSAYPSTIWDKSSASYAHILAQNSMSLVNSLFAWMVLQCAIQNDAFQHISSYILALGEEIKKNVYLCFCVSGSSTRFELTVNIKITTVYCQVFLAYATKVGKTKFRLIRTSTFESNLRIIECHILKGNPLTWFYLASNCIYWPA